MELAKIAFTISPSRATPEANNVGYLHMANGDFDEAKRWFEAGAQYNVDEDQQQLLHYNFGVLSALSGQIEDARHHLRRAKEHPVKSEASCAYELSFVDGKLKQEEVYDPRSLDELSDRAILAINQL
jgi:Flp pilus assembly protein TadD